MSKEFDEALRMIRSGEHVERHDEVKNLISQLSVAEKQQIASMIAEEIALIEEQALSDITPEQRRWVLAELCRMKSH